MMNLLTAIFYIILIVIDVLILWILYLFNPYYGSNSLEDIYTINILINDASYIVDNMNEHLNELNKIEKDINGANNVRKNDMIDNINLKMKKDYLQFIQLLKNLHTHYYNVIING